VKRESNEGGLIPRAFFARSPGGSTVMFCYYLPGGDTVAGSRLYARLCHAFLVIQHLQLNFFISWVVQYHYQQSTETVWR